MSRSFSLNSNKANTLTSPNHSVLFSDIATTMPVMIFSRGSVSQGCPHIVILATETLFKHVSIVSKNLHHINIRKEEEEECW